MTERLKKHKDDIRYLSKCSSKQRRLIVGSRNSSELIKALSDAALTIIKGKVQLTSHQKKEIKSILKVLQTLATKSVPIKKKKRLLVNQRGGAVLGLLWNVLKNIL